MAYNWTSNPIPHLPICPNPITHIVPTIERLLEKAHVGQEQREWKVWLTTCSQYTMNTVVYAESMLGQGQGRWSMLAKDRLLQSQYGLLHYAILISRTGLAIFSFNLLNLAMPLLSYVVCLVLLSFVLLSSLPCYLYDAILILTLGYPLYIN